MTLRIMAAVGLVASFVAASSTASAADLPAREAAPVLVAQPAFTWTGVYLGAFVGGGSGVIDVRSPTGSTLYGDTVRTPFIEGGGQIGYNYQIATTPWMLGVEADGGAVGFNGTNTCGARGGFFVPYNCQAIGTAMATGTGRVGYAFGAEGRTLAYVKGGVAALFEERDVSSTNSPKLGGPFVTTNGGAQVGFTVGAGLEQALSNAWSLKVEYDYTDLGSAGLGYPQSQIESNFRYSVTPPGQTSDRQSLHELKVGLNYHIGAAPGRWNALDEIAPIPTATLAPGYAFDSGYSFEAGGRYWYSFGQFQRDLGSRTSSTSPISRLTYRSDDNSGEAYGRIETPYRVFVKGFVGAGGAAGGSQNDEDFQLGRNIPYSNTISPNLTGSLDYATIDIGYSLLKNRRSNLGVFVGYNYDRDDKILYGCQQIANPNSDCTSGTTAGLPFFQQNERYDSIRLGLNGDMWIGRFRVQADAAYLPFVGFNGVDTHFQRFNVLDQTSPEFGRGQGVQLELIAAYYLTPNVSVGVGGRYWGMWLPTATTNDFGLGIFNDAVRAERYGVTAQLGYRFDSLAAVPVVAKY